MNKSDVFELAILPRGYSQTTGRVTSFDQDVSDLNSIEMAEHWKPLVELTSPGVSRSCPSWVENAARLVSSLTIPTEAPELHWNSVIPIPGLRNQIALQTNQLSLLCNELAEVPPQHTSDGWNALRGAVDRYECRSRDRDVSALTVLNVISMPWVTVRLTGIQESLRDPEVFERARALDRLQPGDDEAVGVFEELALNAQDENLRLSALGHLLSIRLRFRKELDVAAPLANHCESLLGAAPDNFYSSLLGSRLARAVALFYVRSGDSLRSREMLSIATSFAEAHAPQSTEQMLLASENRRLLREASCRLFARNPPWHEEAASEASMLASEESGDPEALLTAADALYLVGELDKCLNTLEHAGSLGTTAASVAFWRASNVARVLSDSDAEQRYLKQCLALDPSAAEPAQRLEEITGIR